jgi:cytochrome d ubiquinol oxidase subunit II
MAFMLLLTALILRASSIEFRNKFASPIWRRAWDWAFFASGAMAALLFGVAVGNGMIGIPLNERGVFTGSMLDELRPYPLLVGLLTVAMFAMHGAMYLYLKIPRGELHQRISHWIWTSWGSFLVLYLLTTIYTLVAVRGAIPNFQRAPWAMGVVLVNILAVANIPRMVFSNKPRQAFLSSVVTIAALIALFGIALWPNLVTAQNDPTHSLTVYRSASSNKTLGFMLVIACIGMPLVLTYTTIMYWTFRRRVEAGASSY